MDKEIGAEFEGYIQNPDGSVDIDLDSTTIAELEAEVMSELLLTQETFYDNLVNDIDEDVLEELAEKVICSFESDEESRSEWMRTITKGLDILGLGIEEINEPYEGACSASHPLILEAAVKFQAKSSAELLPAKGPVKTQVMGTPTPELEQQANRVKRHMNWQVTTQMTEYYDDKERMLLYLPLIGSAFTKTYWCGASGRPVSEMVPVDQFVVPFNATDLFRASRYTHVLYRTKEDLKKDVKVGLYRDDTLKLIGEPTQIELTDMQSKVNKIVGTMPGTGEFDTVYTLLEQHVTCYIPGIDEEEDDLAKPYIVTVDKHSGTVIGVRRNWKFSDAARAKKVMFTHYPFVPGLGFYGLGYIHLLGNLQMTLTTALRALVDAGQFANLQGGFKSKTVRMPKDQGPIRPGEFRDIEMAGQDLSKAIMPLPFKEPSPTLFQLLQFIESRGLKFADATEQVIADSSNYGKTGTTMALLDESTKFFTAAHKRLHFAQKRELTILAQINAEYLDEQFEYFTPGSTSQIFKEDYDDRIDVIPVSDPNIASNAHRITRETGKAQYIQQLGAMDKVNLSEFLRRGLAAFGEDDLDLIIPPEKEIQPQDPLSDIMSAVKGAPIKAFPGQNHQAHIQVKETWMQDPMGGNNPQMQMAIPALQANIREHMLMSYQEQIQALLGDSGVTGAATDQNTLEMVLVESAKMLLENNKAAQIINAEGTPEDKIADAELISAQVDVEALDHKRKRDFADAALKSEKLRLDAIKEANRHAEAKEKLMSGITTQRMQLGKEMALEGLRGLRESSQVR